MKKLLFALMCCFFVLVASLVTGADKSEPAPAQVQEKTHFRHWEKVYIRFAFLPLTGEEKVVEFRWFSPLGSQEQKYEHVIDQTQLKKNQVYEVEAWLGLNLPALSKIFGSKYFGQWKCEIFIDGRKITEKNFTVD